MLYRLKPSRPVPMFEVVGYEQALARVTELRTLAGVDPRASALPATPPIDAAAFQATLAAAGVAPGGAAAPAAFGSTPVLQAGTDQWNALVGAGLPAQAALGATPAPAAAAAPTHVTGKLKGLDPQIVRGLEEVGRAIGKPIEVISGLRTRAEQARLYQMYLNGTGNLAAPPGSSNHEHGGAADAYVDGVALANVPGAREAAERAGLHFPVPGEAWHVEHR